MTKDQVPILLGFPFYQGDRKVKTETEWRGSSQVDGCREITFFDGISKESHGGKADI